MAGRLVPAGAGPALVRFAHAVSAGSPHCVAGRLVQGWFQLGWLTQDQQAVPIEWRDSWSRAGASQVGLRTTSRRSNSVAGRLVHAGSGPALVRFSQLAVPSVWRDGRSMADASQVGSRTTSRRSNSVAGRLVQAGAGPALVRFAHAVSAGSPHCVAGRLVQGWCQLGWLTHDQQADPFCGGTAVPGLVKTGEYVIAPTCRLHVC